MRPNRHSANELARGGLEILFRNDHPDDLDLGAANVGDAEILPVDFRDFLFEVTLDGVELGIGTHFETKLGVEFAIAARNFRPGSGNPIDLHTTGFQKTVKRVFGNFELPGFLFREDQRALVQQCGKEENQNGGRKNQQPQRNAANEVFEISNH